MISKSTIQIPGAELARENPLPMFRAKEHHQAYRNDGTLSEEEMKGLGMNTGFRVLPYCMQDRFSFEKVTRSYEMIVLENEKLRAQFLPQYGGRLYSLFDKKEGRELLFKNPVFQPANLAIRNAWFSGGVEWNIGQLGHACHTCDDVFFAKCKDDNGEEFLRLYDYVRTTGLFWQVDFHLPEGAEFLYAHVRIHNDGEEAKPLYWWTNTAVKEEGVRIFSGSGELIYIKPDSLEKEGDVHAYGHAGMPQLPHMPGLDVSYPQNFKYTSEYFFQNPSEEKAPWEAAAYPDGHVFLERATQPLRIRKMFCWGMHRGGRNWLDHLALPGEGDYVEIQAGLTPTQSHGAEIQAGGIVEFTQAFGSMTMGKGEAFEEEWASSCKKVRESADRALSPDILAQLDKIYCQSALLPCTELLHQGHGYAALEEMRREVEGEPAIPAQLVFPKESIGEKEKKWADILQELQVENPEMLQRAECWNPEVSESAPCSEPQVAEESDPSQLPESWMTDSKWRRILEAALARQPYKAARYIDLGVLEYENGNYGKAERLWKESLKLNPTVIAHRCLAVAFERKGELEAACTEMEQAFELEGVSPSVYITEELMALLKERGSYERMWEIYRQLPDSVAQDERIMILAASAAVNIGEEEFLEKVYGHTYAVIREGENQLCDIWFRHQAIKHKRLGDERTLEVIEEEVRRTLAPPQNIDYRLLY